MTESLLTLSKQRMQYELLQNKLASENIANANTPYYKTKATGSFESLYQKSMPLKTTKGRHFQSTTSANFDYSVREVKTPFEKINKNNVSLENEIMKLNQAKINYETSLNLYKKSLDFIELSQNTRGR